MINEDLKIITECNLIDPYRKEVKRKPIIGVDVDLTVVDTLTPWLHWYEQCTGETITEEMLNAIPYGVEVLMDKHDDPMEYWKNCELYDGKTPINGSIGALQVLSEHYNIIFVSDTLPEHMESKNNFIDKFFPFHKGFIATKQKHLVNMDWLIDDKIQNVIDCGTWGIRGIVFETPLNKIHTPKGFFHTNNWGKIADVLMRVKGVKNED